MAQIEKAVYGKSMKPVGQAPAIALVNPKYPHNVGAALRAASCFGIRQLWFSGNRVSLDPEKGERLPREERMRGYKDVELRQCDYFFEQFPKDVTPVAIELLPGSELLTSFMHPQNALYVFGPEDGTIPNVVRAHCHRFVAIPTRHCTNLAAAVYIVLYDRMLKRIWNGDEQEPLPGGHLVESRGWSADFAEDDGLKELVH